MSDANLNEALGQLAVARRELRSARGVLHWVTGLLACLAIAPLLPIHLPPDLLARGIVMLFSVTLGHQALWWWEARETGRPNTRAPVSSRRPDAC